MVHTAHPDAKLKCPKCGSGHIDVVDENTVLICLDCGFQGVLWTGDHRTKSI